MSFEITDEILQKLIDVARVAGDITLKYFQKDVDVQIKDNDSPVTLADQEAEKAILKVLREIDKDAVIVAEEEAAAGFLPDHNVLKDFWLVDPLDGTKEFINDRPNYTVNIAYMRDKEPYFGLIFAPARDLMLYGFADQDEAYLYDSETGKFEGINTSDKGHADHLNVVTSLSQSNGESFKKYIEPLNVADIKHYGSSLKFCTMAMGMADIYPRFKPTSEWDTAAGHAILRAAGGDIYTVDGNPLKYAKRADFLNPYFIAKTNSVSLITDDVFDVAVGD
ncbi:MAG: 3'(2'),5'-bisphosphate nucleotidase [Rickettsiales bacterium]|nr:3'(2'),5'-bisphosphate nucleotidase [Rickettsiales bacterium]|tara:strand:- start:3409 stop:4245 length:837 start_codon:yes stop_codon:yes gene_type:complete